ncbi:MAG: PIN domain-containing protein [Dehalococcoidia bacterium]
MLNSALRERRVFIDSSAFYALLERDDEQHWTATAIAARLESTRASLFTTNFVIAESHGLFLSRSGRRSAREYLASTEDSKIEVVRASPEDELLARSIIYRYTDKEYSLVGAISFAVMERLSIRTAFAFDRDFVRYGFQPARP